MKNWKNLDRSECCPISLEPLCELDYPPFQLDSDHLFDAKMLAEYLVVTGNFCNPLSRKPLTRASCQKLDAFLLLHNLEEFKVASAFDMQSMIRRKNSSHSNSHLNSRDIVAERNATVVLHSLFEFQQYRNSKRKNDNNNNFRFRYTPRRTENGVIDDNDWAVERRDILTSETLNSEEHFPTLPKRQHQKLSDEDVVEDEEEEDDLKLFSMDMECKERNGKDDKLEGRDENLVDDEKGKEERRKKRIQAGQRARLALLKKQEKKRDLKKRAEKKKYIKETEEYWKRRKAEKKLRKKRKVKQTKNDQSFVAKKVERNESVIRKYDERNNLIISFIVTILIAIGGKAAGAGPSVAIGNVDPLSFGSEFVASRTNPIVVGVELAASRTNPIALQAVEETSNPIVQHGSAETAFPHISHLTNEAQRHNEFHKQYTKHHPSLEHSLHHMPILANLDQVSFQVFYETWALAVEAGCFTNIFSAILYVALELVHLFLISLLPIIITSTARCLLNDPTVVGVTDELVISRFILGFACLYVLQYYIESSMKSGVGMRFEHNVMKAVQQKDLSFSESELIRNDIVFARKMFMYSAPTSVRFFFASVFCILALFVIDWRFGLVGLATTLLLFLTLVLYRRFVAHHHSALVDLVQQGATKEAEVYTQEIAVKTYAIAVNTEYWHCAFAAGMVAIPMCSFCALILLGVSLKQKELLYSGSHSTVYALAFFVTLMYHLYKLNLSLAETAKESPHARRTLNYVNHRREEKKQDMERADANNPQLATPTSHDIDFQSMRLPDTRRVGKMHRKYSDWLALLFLTLIFTSIVVCLIYLFTCYNQTKTVICSDTAFLQCSVLSPSDIRANAAARVNCGDPKKFEQRLSVDGTCRIHIEDVFSDCRHRCYEYAIPSLVDKAKKSYTLIVSTAKGSKNDYWIKQIEPQVRLPNDTSGISPTQLLQHGNDDLEHQNYVLQHESNEEKPYFDTCSKGS
eukprot:g1954.t1